MSTNGFADHGRDLDEKNFGESKGGISVKSFDAFPKTKKTYLTSTSRYGGLFTILIGLACAYLTITEFGRWMVGTTRFAYTVEKGIAHELQINLDIVVAMKCSTLHINMEDAAGDWVRAGEVLKLDPTLFHIWDQPEPEKDRIAREKREKKLAAQRGDSDSDSDTKLNYEALQAQMEQYQKQEDVHTYLNNANRARKFKKTPRLKGKEAASDACRIYGSIEGNKVQGDLHITARGHGYESNRPSEHVEHNTFNFSHHINELSFGPFFPNIHNPLDSTREVIEDNFYKFQYYLSVVPTIYTDALHQLDHTTPPHLTLKQYVSEKRKRQSLEQRSNNNNNQGAKSDSSTGQGSGMTAADRKSLRFNPFALSPHTIYTNQYAVTEQGRQVTERHVPGIFLKYDIEPILLTVSEEWGGIIGLLVRCVNVIAGVCAAGAWLVKLADWSGHVLGSRRRTSATRAGAGLLFNHND